MADLGNLYFDILLRDMTDADIDKIKKKLEKVGVKIGVDANRATLAKNIREALKNRTFKIDVEPNKKIKKASVEVNKSMLTKSVTDALNSKTFKANVDLVVKEASVQAAIKQAFAKAGMNYNTTASDVRAARVAEIQQRMAMRAANANRNLANSYSQAAGGADQFARASATLSGGLHTNIRLGGQLGTTLGNLASIIGLKDVLQDIVSIGGQLENQRIALGSILQDGGKATAVFSKIQSLAVKSPFGIMDLNQYVKQLSAYQVPYNELYDTMKRLADISAGVGVDMGRIILAFGQVKAAGFLKGTELRQFTEANIPMVKALADRFTELRGEIVSAAEVYDMISKKQITFEDVKSVLWDLTDEGGMFNNMQEVLSESLASKWKNLADAIDVMYGKMADGTMGNMLKGVAEMLTNLTHQWQYIASGIATATGMFIAHKVAVVAGSKQIASASNAYNSLLMNKRQMANALMQESIFRKLKKSEQGIIDTKNKLTKADVKAAIASGQLNKQQVLTLVAMKKLDPALLRGQQRILGISAAELRAAQNATKFQIALANLKISLSNFGNALKVMFLNPWFLATTAITGLVEIFTYFNNKSKESDQRIKDSLQLATEGYRNLNNALQEVEGTPNTDAGLISGIEKMTTTLKDYVSNWAEILGKIYEKDESGDYINELETRYDLLKEKLLQTKEAYELLAKSMSGFSESANDATDGVWDESLIVNLKDLSGSMSEYNKHLNEMTRNSILYKDAVAAAAKADTDFSDVIKGKDFRDQIDLLKDYEKATDAFREYLYKNENASTYGVFNEFESTFISLKNDFKTAEKDIETFANAYKELLKGIGIDANNLSEEQKIAIGVDLTGFIDKIEGLNDETKKLFYQRVLEKEFNINVTAKFEEGVNEERWRLELIKAAGGEDLEKEVEVMIKGASDYESVVEAVREMYKDANEVVKDLNPVLLKAGVQFDAGEEIDENNVIFWGLDKETQKAVKEWNKASKQIKAAQNIANDQGFLLTVKKDGGSGKDAVAEMWKKRVDEIEKAVAAYDKWKKIEGALNAENRIKGEKEFANLFNGAYGFNLMLENPTSAYEYVQSQLNEKLEKQRELYVSLGVKISDAEFKDAEEKFKLFIDETKRQIKETSEQWNLYKQLFEATGDRDFASTAFERTQVWDNAAIKMKEKLEGAMKSLGLDFDADFDIDDSTAKEVYGDLYDSWKQIKDHIEKKGIDVKVNASKAIQSTQSIEEKIKSLETQRDEELKNYTEGTEEYDAVAKDWENKIIALRGELFELSPAFKELFVDTTGMASGKLHELWQKANALVSLINKNTTRIVTNANGENIGRYFTDEEGNEQYTSEKQFKNLNEQTDKLSKKVPKVKVAFNNLWNAIKGESEEGYGFVDIANDISILAQEAANAAQSISVMFDSLGNESAADVASLTGNMLNSVSQIGQGIATGNPLSVINGIANGISSIAKFHDKKLDRAIQKSQLEVTKLSNAYSQLETLIERQLGGVTTKQSKEMLDNLKKQRSELYKQYDLEDDKKKTDKSKLEDYKNQIAELNDQIKYFYEDLASNQYGADISDWAGQIADALTEAFASGEDAAKAFDDTVSGILKELATEAIRLQFIEPAMNQLRNYLFGSNGIFTDNSESGTALSKSELAGLSSELDKLKSQIQQSNEYWDYINEATGGLLENTEKSESSLSKTVQGVTENTADLLASYLNGIRVDVSVKRSLIEKLIADDIPQMSVIAQAQLTQLNNIAANTLRNADAADRIYDLFNRVVDKGGNKLKI